MRNINLSVLASLALLALAAGQLTGCADERYAKGLEWIQANELQKKQLDDAGFPQYDNSP